MRDWRLSITFHWPHDRFAFGFQTIQPQEEEPYWTLTLYLGIATLDLDLESSRYN